jgi:magnesium chelatase family protein
MVATVATAAYLGLEARNVEVQVQVAPGVPAFVVVGLPDKAVAESRERVRAAIAAIGLALPPKRITVNLSPADLPKEGSHYDLPIALGLLGAMGIVDAETLSGYVVVGELSLDGRIAARIARGIAGVGDGEGAGLPRRARVGGELGRRCRSAGRARPDRVDEPFQGTSIAARPAPR